MTEPPEEKGMGMEPREQPEPPMLPDSGRLLIVGARRRLRKLARYLDQGPLSGLPVVGYVDLSGRGRQLAIHPKSDPVPVLGRLDRLAELVDRSRATHVVVALSERPAKRLGPELSNLNGADLRVHWVGEEPPKTSDQQPLHRRLQPPRSRRRRPVRSRWRRQRLAKRLVDVAAALGGLIAFSPLFLVVAVLIYFTSGRPIFYKQQRVGQGGRLFWIWKFRSMRPDAEGSTGPIWASNHDERCTPVGDWLRSSSIDELPQLWNILRGDMSLVGPRPERPIFVDQFVEEIPDYELRHVVPVGLTGWAQVHGWRGRTSLRKRLQYDLDYIRRWSFWLDLQILYMTVSHVFFGKVDWGESNAQTRRIEREPTDALGRDTHLQRPQAPANLPAQPPATPPQGA